ncbi:hypothetical protein [Occultella gossypii]|uniref:DUF3592 domain-containing protein n=1 Tax=Occultella gossypii TaxID=2800820 RepID=A0ABS7S785_9MICO|nr:hypothetical protein [Occultella gossypii]MBZ2195474.1 hypothetical protein [Occultella gossypii]
MLDQGISADAATSPAVLIAANLIWIAALVVIILVVLRLRRGRQAAAALPYQDAPVGQGVVEDRKFRYRIVNSRHLYTITYRVHTPDGHQFLGREDKYLGLIVDKPKFAVGTRHPVAYWPGVDEVRALTPTR